MKAPDKCYITREKNGVIYSLSLNDNGGIEYIRKDDLIEWLKECFRLQDGGSWYSKGAADAFSKVIDKLNSM